MNKKLKEGLQKAGDMAYDFFHNAGKSSMADSTKKKDATDVGRLGFRSPKSEDYINPFSQSRSSEFTTPFGSVEKKPKKKLNFHNGVKPY